VSKLSGKTIVETKNLTKRYDNSTAVDKLNLCIEAGDLFGFLGPNGAGKTTTILMLLGLTEPTGGSAQVGGYNSTREPLKVKSISGYIPENVGFYDNLTASYNLAYIARLNNLPEDVVSRRVKETLDIVGLADHAEQAVGEFSKGMKQRLALADILIKRPQVAILDEPTAGIDPEGIKQLLDLIANIARERKMTVIMSSHQLSQVQQICNQIGIMVQGKLLVKGSPESLGKESGDQSKFRIEIRVTEITQNIIDAIKAINGVLSVDRADDQILIGCSKDLRP